MSARPLRRKSRSPSADSNCLICVHMDGCERLSFAAAARMLPSAATA